MSLPESWRYLAFVSGTVMEVQQFVVKTHCSFKLLIESTDFKLTRAKRPAVPSEIWDEDSGDKKSE